MASAETASSRLCIFAKAPVPGRVKTRLIPALGAARAARLAEKLLGLTLAEALASRAGNVELTMAPAPDDPAWSGVTLPAAVHREAQGDGDLGQRLARTVERALEASAEVLLIGADCPALTAVQIDAALDALESADAVMTPAHDGGYVLLGLKQPLPRLFDDMPWSSADVARLTLERLGRAGRCVAVRPPLHDIDVPADLAELDDATVAAISAGRR